jgi:hypothetical protein
MEAEMVGDLTTVDGYLYVADHLVVWQTDYFVNTDNGTIEILDREGKVVAREGEELVMGGGSVPLDSNLNRMLKEPLPAGIAESVWVQGEGPRLSLNYNSELFGLDAVSSGDRRFYCLTAKPPLEEGATQRITVTGTFSTGIVEWPMRNPVFFGDPEPDKTPTQYTVFWPQGYRARASDGTLEVLDSSGRVVARAGDKVQIEGKVLYGATTGIPWQLHDELPGGCFQPYLIVDRVIR